MGRVSDNSCDHITSHSVLTCKKLAIERGFFFYLLIIIYTNELRYLSTTLPGARMASMGELGTHSVIKQSDLGSSGKFTPSSVFS